MVGVLPGHRHRRPRGRWSFNAGTVPVSVAAGDVNGDGKVDLVTANRGGERQRACWATAPGSFGAAQNYAAGSQPRSVALADFNGDGKLDLVTANAAAPSRAARRRHRLLHGRR